MAVKKKPARRRLKDLNLIDDFLFGTMMTHPAYGERFARILLEAIFGGTPGGLQVHAQNVYYAADTDLHGAQVDVYIEEEDGDVFDIEAESGAKTGEPEEIRKRLRFYHALLDSRMLKRGDSYRSLRRVCVIMILPSDPLGGGCLRYTIRNACEKNPDIPYDDGAATVILFTRGKPDSGEERLAELLRYMERTEAQYAVNDTLKELHEMVCEVKKSKEATIQYMKRFEREQMLIEEGRALEQENTEAERRRADAAQKRADIAWKQLDEERKQADEIARKNKDLLDFMKVNGFYSTLPAWLREQIAQGEARAMKQSEREQMLIEEGRALEQENTEAERRRADAAQKRADEIARKNKDLLDFMKENGFYSTLPAWLRE